VVRLSGLLHLGEQLVTAPAGDDQPWHIVPSRGGAASSSRGGSLPRRLLALGPPRGAGVRRHAVLHPGLALRHGDTAQQAGTGAASSETAWGAGLAGGARADPSQRGVGWACGVALAHEAVAP